jgi:hypothetical protein
VNSRLFGEGSVRVTWTGVRGRPGLSPTLVITGEIMAKGYSPGAVVLITAEVTASDLGAVSRAYIGPTAPMPVVLAWVKQQWVAPNPPPPDETTHSLEMQVQLDAAAAEALEAARQGGSFTLLIDTTILLVSSGTPGPEASVEKPVHYSTHPVLTLEERLPVSRETWGQVLQQWGTAAAVLVLVHLPFGDVHPDHAEVVRCIREAEQRIDGGDYEGAIIAARKSLEVLRGLSPAAWPLPPAPKDRAVNQRTYAAIDALFQLASAAAHADGSTSNFKPRREDAVAILAGTAAMAVQVFDQLGNQ